MKRALLTLCAVLLAASVAACSGNDSDASPAATLGTAPTTETTLSVEQEVEAAYLRSWDVYTEAVLTFDKSKLEETFDGPALRDVIADVDSLSADNTPARMDVEHNYEIEVVDDLARVIDNYVNHSVLLDGKSQEPIEDDPNKRLRYEYMLQRIEGAWKVVDILRP